MKRTYYFLTLFMLLLSAKASVISSNDISWGVFEVILLFIAIKRKLFTSKVVKTLLIFTGLYALLIFSRSEINSSSDTYLSSDFFFFAKFVLAAFLYGLVLKEKVITYFIKVISDLSVISLIFFPIQLADSNLVNGIGKLFDLVGLGAHNVTGGYNNYLFFTVYDTHITRNCGFSWEPGAFACLLSLALVFTLLRDNFKFNKQSYIISAALITTVSTTGYILLLILIILKVFNSSKNRARFIYIIPVALIMVLVFINSPVLYKKIQDVYTNDMNNSSNYDDLQTYYGQENQTIPLNRFASIIQVFLIFNYKLILGVSNKYDEILNKQYNFNISNGIADFLAKLGLISFFFYVRNYLKFVKAYTKSTFNLVVICVLFLIIFFGEPLLSMPIFFLFGIYPFFWNPVAVPPYTSVRKISRVNYPEIVNN